MPMSKCGNIEYIASNVLKSKRKYCSKCHNRNSTLIDITGQQFGWLEVLERDMNNEHTGHENDAYWICKCKKCGNKKSIRGFSLRKGITQSCGCIKSTGEEIITKILLENNIPYIKEYSFKDLIYKQPLRFDFAIFNSDGILSHLIEYDGIQHFQYRESGWNNKENFELTKIRDEIKNNYCKENGIKLIRIKYNENITLEKLMGEENGTK